MIIVKKTGNEKIGERVLRHSVDIFDEARNVFLKETDMRGKIIPVVNEKGNIIYFLKWEMNQVESHCHVKEFWNYDINNPLIDYELLSRCEVYVFFTLEEYTYQIARIIPQSNCFS